MTIFESICRILTNERIAALATIVGTSGSTPAVTQSRMIVRLTNPIRTVGTVGGGCIDAEILWSVAHERESLPRVLSISLDDPVGDTGLICGGTVEVLLEIIDSSMLPVFERIVSKADAGTDCVLLTQILQGQDSQKLLYSKSGELVAGRKAATLHSERIHTAITNMTCERPVEIFSVGTEMFALEYIEAPPPLVIFGGGHVGKVVSQCAALAGFGVTVVDDRRVFADKKRFPQARRVLCEGFAEAFDRINITPSTYVVIVTRGHRYDEFVLEKVIRLDAQYVGMIGSRRKVELTMSHLVDKGIPHELLEKVHAPIGLHIGSQTPEEIGVSIVAELISVRRSAGYNGVSP